MSDLVGLIPAHAGKTSCRSPGWPESAAHPRSRGENVFKVFEEGLHTGSSPLTRGKPQARRRDRRRRRLIPPHAGKTHDTHVTPPARRAHPRSRGENHRCVHLRTVASGSSPLTRGKPRANASMSARVGLIPAHAGKTGRRRGRSQQLSAHPRSRGENAGTASRRESRAGSSPLTRGKQGGYRVNGRGLRLIPAHAGKTAGRLPPDAGAAAHPRSRGENFSRPKVTPLLPGSSPLTRGKRVLTPRPAALARLIPAHAGKTSTVYKDGEAVGAHPRSRGENLRLIAGMGPQLGSSPLTRGKLPDRGSDRKAGRLIPAHAGKTTRPTSSRTRCPAHPRSRGENGAKMKRALSKVGSSPLTRGKHVIIGIDIDVRGLIPAHAGKTCSSRADLVPTAAHPRSRGENSTGW